MKRIRRRTGNFVNCGLIITFAKKMTERRTAQKGARPYPDAYHKIRL